MVFENLGQLGTPKLAEVIKVDDTKTGGGEGLSAGVWSVCVTEYSNNVGSLFNTFEQYLEAKKDKETFAHRICQTEEQLGNDSGVHYIIPNINFLPQVINDINERLENGETPMNVIDQFPPLGNNNDTQEERDKRQPLPS